MNLVQLIEVRLRLRAGARFHSFHGPALYAFLLDRLGNPALFPAGIGIVPVERGRATYEPGEHYHFGLTLLPGASPTLDEWLVALAAPPRTAFGKTEHAPFGRHTVVIGAHDCIGRRPHRERRAAEFLQLEHLDRAAEELCATGTIEFWFDTPVQILRTPVARKNTILDGTVFDVERFFVRTRDTVGAAYPALTPLGAIPTARVTRNRLLRTDSAYPKTTLIGTSGSIVVELAEPLDRSWARALLLAGVLGVGKSTNMGLGRFSANGIHVAPGWPPEPARTLCQRAAALPNLHVARRALADAGPAPGVDGIDRDRFLTALEWRIDNLAETLAASNKERGT